MNRSIVLAGCLAAFLVSAARAADMRMERDLEFAVVDGQSLKLDFYFPKKAKGSSLVVWIHGGGWQGGSKEKCEVKWLTQHGFTVASISYRLTDKAIFPAQIHDCKAAIRWLRANADRYGYRIDKVGVAGSSAGGMLAALVATSGDVRQLEGTVGGNAGHSSRVQAAIDYYGATDFILRSKTQPQRANEPGSVVFKLLGGGADKKTDLARLASAAFHVTDDDPPLLVIHGQDDQTVLLDQSERINEVYTKAGLPIDFRVLQGAGHGGKQFYAGEMQRLAIDFLKRTLR